MLLTAIMTCLSCIAFEDSSRPPADCQTCLNQAKSEGGTFMQTSQRRNSSLWRLSCLLHSLLLFRPGPGSRRRRRRCATGGIRWSSTGYSVCWGRRKRRRGRASHSQAPSPQWVSRKWKQRCRTHCNSCTVYTHTPRLSLQHWNRVRKLQGNNSRRSKLIFLLSNSWWMYCS